MFSITKPYCFFIFKVFRYLKTPISRDICWKIPTFDNKDPSLPIICFESHTCGRKIGVQWVWRTAECPRNYHLLLSSVFRWSPDRWLSVRRPVWRTPSAPPRRGRGPCSPAGCGRARETYEQHIGQGDEIFIGSPVLALSGSYGPVPPPLTVFSSSPLLTTSAESPCCDFAVADAISPLASKNNTQQTTTQNLILFLQPVGRGAGVLEEKRERKREGTSYCDFRSVFSLHV